MVRRSFKLASGLAALAVLPLLLSFAPQDPGEVQDPFRQEMVWNFAVFQYVDSRGNLVEVPARNISRMWFLATREDRLRIEILYENRDFSSVEVSDFHMIRSSPSASAVDVPVVRSRFAGMAFPSFQTK
ncbi:MAG: hypothetical protein IPM29_31995 [Planctomycetes bacterium]|nr:hypothetical protein [Planctomycetota bacterium]